VLVQVNEACVKLEKLDESSAQEGSDAFDALVQVLCNEVRHIMDGDTIAAKQDVADNTAGYDAAVDDEGFAFNQVHLHSSVLMPSTVWSARDGEILSALLHVLFDHAYSTGQRRPADRGCWRGQYWR